MSVLKPFTGTGAVFFPVGSPPLGTCAFSTPDCRHHCYMTEAEDKDFDEETRVSDEETRRIWSIINLSESIEAIRHIFLRDLEGLQTPILHWFASGDCLPDKVGRISRIIDAMPDHIIQMGFTRNKRLWTRYREIFVLTIEEEDYCLDSDALYSIPDYRAQTSVMFNPAYEVQGGFCGPHLCMDRDRGRPELTHYINCRTCHQLKTGCFDRR